MLQLRSLFTFIRAAARHHARPVALLALLLASLLLSTTTTPPAAAQGRSRMVLAFYYAWYDPDSFGPGKTPFQPLHPYFSTSETTMRRHINTARAAGLDGFVQSWYGPNPNQQTEPNLRQLLNLANEAGFKVAVHFEVASPFFGGNQDRVDALKALLNTHAQHPAYLRLDGKPVVLFWANWILPVADWRYIREQADPWKQMIWIGEGGHDQYLEVFDGLHLYNVAWSSAPGGVNATWAERTRAAGDRLGSYKYWAATAMPGFDNSLVPGVEHTVRGRGNGNYLRQSFEGAAATSPDLLLLTSFNEWREGSNIEPSREFGNAYIEQMAQLSASYKGIARANLPPIPAWNAPAPTPTPLPPPTNTPAPAPTAPPPPAQVSGNNAGSVVVAAAPPTTAALPTQPPTAAPTAATTRPPVIAQVVLQPTPTPLANGEIVYIVVEGDTLVTIAERFGLTLDALLARNNLSADAPLKIGQRLLLGIAGDSVPPVATLPSVATLPPAAPTVDLFRSTPTPQADGRIEYIVQAGDTLVGIAARYAVPLDTLYTLNDLTPTSLLSVGQTLLLARDQGAVVPIEDVIPPRYAGATLREDDSALLHRVQPGETLIAIALTYGYQTMDDFYAVSGLTASSILAVDQDVVVGYLPQPDEVGGSTDLPTSTPAPTATATATPTATPRPTNTPLPFPTPLPTNTLPAPVALLATEAAPAATPTAAAQPTTVQLALLGSGAVLLLIAGVLLFVVVRRGAR